MVGRGLVAERPADAVVYAQRLRTYLEADPEFYGSAVALLDEDGTVATSSYVYRTAGGYRGEIWMIARSVPAGPSHAERPMV